MAARFPAPSSANLVDPPVPTVTHQTAYYYSLDSRSSRLQRGREIDRSIARYKKSKAIRDGSRQPASDRFLDGSRVANANHSTPGHAVRAIDGWMDGWRDEREREEGDDGCDWWGRPEGTPGGAEEETNNRSVPLPPPELTVLAPRGIKQRSPHVTGRHCLNQPGCLFAIDGWRRHWAGRHDLL